ncbi:MAG TPA: type II secretion system F family protein [Gemmatimonadales bacterium]|nr:type II secretion system F family protein [Gemmatimonadales bacterium]
MPNYTYEAVRRDGSVARGVLEAAHGGQVAALLAERELYLLRTGVAEPPAGRPAAPSRELAIAFRSLAALVGAGVPLERAVGATAPLARGALAEVLAATRQRLREGRSLSQALDESHGLVPAVVVGMVRAGERGSQLGRALDEAARHLEREAELRQRVRQALAYPVVLAVAGTASVMVIGTVVVPKFADLLADLGQQLPPATRLLLDVSDFLAAHWLPLVLGAVVCATGFGAWRATPAGRRTWHRLLLALPVVGRVRLVLATARVTHALGGMLATGMPILTALEGARDAAGDGAVAERLLQVRELVSQGSALSPALERTGAISPAALQLVAVGEQSGELATMATRAGQLAADESERELKTLVTLLEPTLVLVFGVLVAFVAAALLQAIYTLKPGA